MIGEDQYEALSKKGVNVSWLVRDMIDQYLNEKKIVLDVSDETLKIYQKVSGLTGGKNEGFETYFKQALHEFLKSKIDEMQQLEKNVSNKLELIKGKK
ncbi:MAG: hypothetical protein R2877_03880 [Bdellovibrionota bacterium]